MRLQSRVDRLVSQLKLNLKSSPPLMYQLLSIQIQDQPLPLQLHLQPFLTLILKQSLNEVKRTHLLLPDQGLKEVNDNQLAVLPTRAHLKQPPPRKLPHRRGRVIEPLQVQILDR